MKLSYKELKRSELLVINTFFSQNQDNFNFRSRFSSLLEFIPFIKLPSNSSELRVYFLKLVKMLNFFEEEIQDADPESQVMLQEEFEVPNSLEELVQEIEKNIIEKILLSEQPTDTFLEEFLLQIKLDYGLIPPLFTQFKEALRLILRESPNFSYLRSFCKKTKRFFIDFLSISDFLFLKHFIRNLFESEESTTKENFIEKVSIIFKDAKNFRFFRKASLTYSKFKPFLVKNSDRSRFFNLELSLTFSGVPLDSFPHLRVDDKFNISPEGLLGPNEIPRSVSGFVTIGSNLNSDIIFPDSGENVSNLNAVIIWKDYNYHIIDLTENYCVGKKLKQNKRYELKIDSIVVLARDHAIRVKRIENEFKEVPGDENVEKKKALVSRLTYKFIKGQYSVPPSNFYFSSDNKIRSNNECHFIIGKGGQNNFVDFMISFDPKISGQHLYIIYSDLTRLWSVADFKSKNGNYLAINSFADFGSTKNRKPKLVLSEFEKANENWDEYETLMIRDFKFYVTPTPFSG